MIDLKEKAKTTLDEIDIAAVETGKYSDMVDMLEIALRAVRKDALEEAARRAEEIHEVGLITDARIASYSGNAKSASAAIRKLIEGEQNANGLG